VRLLELQRGHLVVDELQAAVGRNHIDVVRLQAVAAGDLHHRHFGARGDDRRNLAAVLRIEMHHDHEGGPGGVGNGGEEVLQDPDAAGWRADRHDHRRTFATGLCTVGHGVRARL
jgi:hypothetical protein